MTIHHANHAAMDLCQPAQLLMDPVAFSEALAIARLHPGRPLEIKPRDPSGFGDAGAMMDTQRREPFMRAGKVGIIPVDGAITYTASFWSWLFGGTTNQQIVRALNAAAQDADLDTVVLDLHSPGGEVAGSSDLIEAVARCAKSKNTVAFVHDQACSLAYWMACGCARVVTTPSGVAGSIGAISVAYDQSKMFAKEGIEAVVSTDARNKAYGVPGVAITDEMRARAQDLIERMGAQFRAHVSRQRGLDDQAILAMQGAVRYGADLISAGLADEVATSDAFYAELMGRTRQSTGRGAGAVSTTPGKPGKDKEHAMSVKDTYAKMSDTERAELKALISAEASDETGDDLEEVDESAETEDTEESAESEDDTPAARTAATSPAKAVAQARAAIKTEAPELPEAEVSRLALASIEHGWSEAKLLREVDKAERQAMDLSGAAASSGQAIGATRPGTGSTSFGSYDQAIKAYEAKGQTYAQAVAAVNREHPDLRQKKFGRRPTA